MCFSDLQDINSYLITLSNQKPSLAESSTAIQDTESMGIVMDLFLKGGWPVGGLDLGYLGLLDVIASTHSLPPLFLPHYHPPRSPQSSSSHEP